MLNTIPDLEFKDRIIRLQQKMKDNGLDLIITYGNEAEPQYVRYFADFWPSFESAGVFVPAEGEPLLIIGPECQTYAEDRSRIKRIEKMMEFRESSEPEYPDMKLTKFSDLFAEFLDNSCFITGRLEKPKIKKPKQNREIKKLNSSDFFQLNKHFMIFIIMRFKFSNK